MLENKDLIRKYEERWDWVFRILCFS